MTLEIGTEWADRYAIQGILGSGGMGTVYRAADFHLDGELVALKILHQNLATDQSQRTRFINEVKLSRKISHPNVVRTLDFGIAQGVPFFSMELIEGKTLRDICSTSRLTFPEICITLIQIVEGLEAIHNAKILHRDLKSANLFVDHDGTVKIGDFGVACVLENEGLPHGKISGSTHYLAPEVWQCKRMDCRADLYALGIISYELCTGLVPIDGESVEELMCKHLSHSIAPLDTVHPDIPRWFSDLTLSLLAKSSAERPRSAREVADSIRAHLKTPAPFRGVYAPGRNLSGDAPPEVSVPPSPLLKKVDLHESSGLPEQRCSANRPSPQIISWLALAVASLLLILRLFF